MYMFRQKFGTNHVITLPHQSWEDEERKYNVDLIIIKITNSFVSDMQLYTQFSIYFSLGQPCFCYRIMLANMNII